MKKAISIIIICTMLIFLLCLSACNSKVEFKVNFVVDGEIYSTISTSGEEVISIPQNPTKEGYEFDGWYWDDGKWQRPFTAKSLLNEPLSSDMSVYAKWAEITAEPEPTPELSGTDLSSSTLAVSGEIANATLSNATQTFSFLNDIKVADEASYILATDIGCQNTIVSKTVALEEGDNTYYLLVTNGNAQKLYTITIRRRPIYTVEFNTNGGTKVETLHIEEDSTIEMQQTSKTGYSFNYWSVNNSQIEFPFQVKKDEIVVANWSVISYTIEYELNNGTNNIENVSNYTIEQTVALKNPTRDYYRFDGWFETADFTGTPVSKINQGTTGNKTLYAKWTPIQYEIEYKLNGGTNNESTVFSYNTEQEITLKNPTREGYAFLGWFTNESFEDSAVEKIALGSGGNKVFYAKWQACENKLVFDGNGSTSGAMIDMIIDTDEMKTLSNNTFEKAGYTFKGWSTTVGGNVEYVDGAKYIMGTNSTYTLYAVWQANNNTIVFDANGGSGNMSNMTVATDATTTLTLIKFARDGYAFKGWSTTADGSVEYLDGANYTMGTNSSYTLYAVWKANNNTLVFEGNGSTDGTMNDMTIATDGKIALPNNIFAKAGYTFKGWSTTADGNVEYLDGANYTMGTNSSYTLYAVWQANNNTIVFEENGATNGTMDDMTIATDETKALLDNKLIKEGYTFKGWSTTADGTVEYLDGANYTMGTNSTYTLYAVWEANNNALVFDANGGSGSMSNIVIATDASIKLTDNVFTREGYIFKGWSTTADDSVEFVDGANYTMGTNDTYTLYAVWEVIEHTIKYNFNSDIISSDNPTTFTIEDLPITLNDLENKSGFVFDGWYKEGDFSGNRVTEINDLIDIELFACYLECTDGLVFTAYNSYSEANMYYSVTGYTGTSTDLVIPKSYNKKPVTTIGAHAIKNTVIKNVTIPDSIISLGTYAFENCTSLQNVYYLGTMEQWCKINFGLFSNPMGDAEHFYLDNKKVTEIVIPKGITIVREYAFYGFNDITSVTVPDTVTKFEYSAFGRTPVSLKKLNYEGTIEQWCEIDFGFDSHPLKYLDSRFYINNVEVTEIVIPEGVTEIKPYSFNCFTTVTKVELPSTLKTIGAYAFVGCAFKSIDLKNVTSIGKAAFSGCTSLEIIKIFNKVTTIGEEAFLGCTSLTIYCEVQSKPDGWNQWWNGSSSTVVWGYKEN